MVLILSRPAGPPPLPVEAFSPLTHEWVTPDGARFDLSDWESGIMLDNRGVEGLHFPRVTKYTSTSRAFHGHRQRGWRAEARDVFWPIQIWGDSTTDFLTRYNAFFGGVQPERQGIWRVGREGSFRELRIVGKFDESYTYELDPALEAWAPYSVSFEAEQPFWTGPAVVAGPWKNAEVRPFFGATSPAPPFYITSASRIGSATMTNPGDLEAYPVWVVDGPLQAVEIGVGAKRIVVPFDVVAGDRLVIDTDPRNVTARRGTVAAVASGGGADVTEQLGFQPVAPIPSGTDVPVHVDGLGTGEVSCTLTPLFFRAF